MRKQKLSIKPSKTALKTPAKPSVEFPRENERIESSEYTIRISAPQARMVRVAINQGPWVDCRAALGYWWFDWSGFMPGEHEFVACADYDDGREAVSAPAHCIVP